MSNPAELIEVNGETIGFVQQMNGDGPFGGKWQASDGQPHKFIQAWDTREDAIRYLFDRHDARIRDQVKA